MTVFFFCFVYFDIVQNRPLSPYLISFKYRPLLFLLTTLLRIRVPSLCAIARVDLHQTQMSFLHSRNRGRPVQPSLGGTSFQQQNTDHRYEQTKHNQRSSFTSRCHNFTGPIPQKSSPGKIPYSRLQLTRPVGSLHWGETPILS